MRISDEKKIMHFIVNVKMEDQNKSTDNFFLQKNPPKERQDKVCSVFIVEKRLGAINVSKSRFSCKNDFFLFGQMSVVRTKILLRILC